MYFSDKGINPSECDHVHTILIVLNERVTPSVKLQFCHFEHFFSTNSSQFLQVTRQNRAALKISS